MLHKLVLILCYNTEGLISHFFFIYFYQNVIIWINADFVFSEWSKAASVEQLISQDWTVKVCIHKQLRGTKNFLLDWGLFELFNIRSGSAYVLFNRGFTFINCLKVDCAWNVFGSSFCYNFELNWILTWLVSGEWSACYRCVWSFWTSLLGSGSESLVCFYLSFIWFNKTIFIICGEIVYQVIRLVY